MRFATRSLNSSQLREELSPASAARRSPRAARLSSADLKLSLSRQPQHDTHRGFLDGLLPLPGRPSPAPARPKPLVSSAVCLQGGAGPEPAGAALRSSCPWVQLNKRSERAEGKYPPGPFVTRRTRRVEDVRNGKQLATLHFTMGKTPAL